MCVCGGGGERVIVSEVIFPWVSQVVGSLENEVMPERVVAGIHGGGGGPAIQKRQKGSSGGKKIKKIKI